MKKGILGFIVIFLLLFTGNVFAWAGFSEKGILSSVDCTKIYYKYYKGNHLWEQRCFFIEWEFYKKIYFHIGGHSDDLNKINSTWIKFWENNKYLVEVSWGITWWTDWIYFLSFIDDIKILKTYLKVTKVKDRLNKTIKWRKYIKRIDIKRIDKIAKVILPKLSDEKLLKLLEKINKFYLSKKYKKYRNILMYLKWKVLAEKLDRKYKKDKTKKLDFKIIKSNLYGPTVVEFNVSESKIKWKTIEQFIFDFWDGWIRLKNWVRYAKIEYNKIWEYNIKLIVITSDWEEYSVVKKLIIKPKPQIAKIQVSAKKVAIWQIIDFSSKKSEWQIIWYFWDFWDWSISTSANPIYKYDKKWKYKVKLNIEFSNKNILQDEVEIEIY